ncbi:MAG: hypothetical protein H7175_28615, partial [Burkholderiales bacterium]|nr:hypothetical protein [Anaerolineae bacterium]
ALCKRGLMVRFEDGETILYRVNLRRRSGGQIIQNILQALGLKPSESGEKTGTGETGLRRGGNRVLPKSIWDALGETKKSTSEEAETVLNLFQSPANSSASEEQADKRAVTLAHSLWDAVTSDEEKAAEDAKELLRSQINRRSVWDALDDESAADKPTETAAKDARTEMDALKTALSEPVPDKKIEVDVLKAVLTEPEPLEKLVVDGHKAAPTETQSPAVQTGIEAVTPPPPPPMLPEEKPTPKPPDA